MPLASGLRGCGWAPQQREARIWSWGGGRRGGGRGRRGGRVRKISVACQRFTVPAGPLWNHSYWTRVEGKERQKSRTRWVLAGGVGPTRTTHAWRKSRCLGSIALTTASASVGRGGPTAAAATTVAAAAIAPGTAEVLGGGGGRPLPRTLRQCLASAATGAGFCSGRCRSARPPGRSALPPVCSSTWSAPTHPLALLPPSRPPSASPVASPPPPL